MVLNGIDIITHYDALFAGKKLGVLTSLSGVSRDLIPSWKILAERYKVTALFAPEHGLFGCEDAGTIIETGTLSKTEGSFISGIPVYSLYRKNSQDFENSMFDNVDVLVYDIQDVGTRFYTYISTLILALRAAHTYCKEVIVLDRVNPLGGMRVEGNIVQKQYESFVGIYPLCIRYALTVGELAKIVHTEERLSCSLQIVPLKNWTRGMLFNETGLLWVPPSPNIPHFESALLYPGVGLLEGTNISEGRGTPYPFSMTGAPFIDAEKLAGVMEAKKLPGVRFIPARFTPTASKHAGVLCCGVQIFITDYKAFEAVKTGVELLLTIKTLYPDNFSFLPIPNGKSFASIERLCGSPLLKEASTAQEVISVFEKEAAVFFKRVKPFFLYGETL